MIQTRQFRATWKEEDIKKFQGNQNVYIMMNSIDDGAAWNIRQAKRSISQAVIQYKFCYRALCDCVEGLLTVPENCYRDLWKVTALGVQNITMKMKNTVVGLVSTVQCVY